jgi:ribosomal protein S18 acetylase RimI-like enzyme
MSEDPLALRPPNPNLIIRPVRLADCEPLRLSCWPDRRPDAVYRFISRVRQTTSQGRGLGVVVVGADGGLRGYGQLTLWPRCAEISDLIVASAYRSQGIGTAIIQYLVRAAREMHCNCIEIGVAVSNPGALALYRRLGFKDSFTQTLNVRGADETVLYLRLKLRQGV